MQKLILILVASCSFLYVHSQVMASPVVLAMVTSGSGNSSIKLGCHVENINLTAYNPSDMTEDNAAFPAPSMSTNGNLAYAVYPNPANSSFSLVTEPNLPGNIKLTIYNTLGQVMSEYSTNAANGEKQYQQIDASGYANGVYFIRFAFTNGYGAKQVSTQKIQIIH